MIIFVAMCSGIGYGVSRNLGIKKDREENRAVVDAIRRVASLITAGDIRAIARQ